MKVFSHLDSLVHYHQLTEWNWLKNTDLLAHRGHQASFGASTSASELVTQLMMQQQPNCMELRLKDSYIQILCGFQKSKQKVPPPSLHCKCLQKFTGTLRGFQIHGDFMYTHNPCNFWSKSKKQVRTFDIYSLLRVFKFPYNFCGDFRQHVISVMITCTLQGMFCDTGIPALFMGEKFAVHIFHPYSIWSS